MLRIDDTYNAGLPNVPGMVVHKDSWVYVSHSPLVNVVRCHNEPPMNEVI